MNRVMKQALSSVIKYKIGTSVSRFPAITYEDLVLAAEDYYSEVVDRYDPLLGSEETFEYWSYRKGMERFLSPMMAGSPSPRKLLYPDQAIDLDETDITWDKIMNDVDEVCECPSHAVELLELNELLEEVIKERLGIVAASVIKDLFGLNESRKSRTTRQVAAMHNMKEQAVYKMKYAALEVLSKDQRLVDIKSLYLGR